MPNYIFDREKCIDLVNNLNDGEKLNYSKLATDLKLRHENGTVPKNGGQIIKGFLEESGIDLKRFGNLNGGFRIRKRKKRLLLHLIYCLYVVLIQQEIRKNENFPTCKLII